MVTFENVCVLIVCSLKTSSRKRSELNKDDETKTGLLFGCALQNIQNNAKQARSNGTSSL
jgi:hypothetical protein